MIKPNDTTSLARIEPPAAIDLNYPVNIDFGSTATPSPWLLNASNNTTTMASFSNILPADDGTVTIKMGAGANNNNEYKFFYINSMTIAPSAPSGLKKVNDVTFKLYPNPVTDRMVIESEQSFDKIEIFDVSGKTVLKENYPAAFSKELDVSNLKKGYYIVKVQHQCYPLIKQ